MILAIDPGLTGAICVISKTKVEFVEDMPTMAAIHGKGNVVNPYALNEIFKKARKLRCRDAYIEQVAAMPGQGVSSMFKFGASFGVILGIAASNEMATKMVTPQKWKKYCRLVGRDKDAARTLAIQTFPEVAKLLSRKKDIGRADSLMIGHYAQSLS